MPVHVLEVWILMQQEGSGAFLRKRVWYDNKRGRREDSPLLRVSRLCDHQMHDRMSEKLWVPDFLPFVPVCCHELAPQADLVWALFRKPDETQV